MADSPRSFFRFLYFAGVATASLVAPAGCSANAPSGIQSAGDLDLAKDSALTPSLTPTPRVAVVDAEPGSSSTAEPEPAIDSDQEIEEATSAEPVLWQSPIEGLFADGGAHVFSFESDNRAFEERRDFAERCVAEYGFEYKYDREDPPDPAWYGDSKSFVTAVEYLLEDGYGVANSLTLMFEEPSDDGDWVSLYPSDEASLANAQYDETLSRPEQDKYLEAQNECITKLNEEVPDPDELYVGNEALFMLENEIYSSAEELIQSSEDRLELESEWQECMASEGLSFTSRGEIAEHFAAEAAPFFESVVDSSSEISEDARVKIESLITEERRIAKVDFRCSQSIDYTRRWAEIVTEAEQEVVDEHGERWILQIQDALAG